MVSNIKLANSPKRNFRLLVITGLLVMSIVLMVSSVKFSQIINSNAYDLKLPEIIRQINKKGNYTTENFYLGVNRMAMYYPTESSQFTAPYPVLIFHHGLMAKYDYYTWLAEALVKMGYIVVMPNRSGLGMSISSGANLNNSILKYLENRNKNGELKQAIDLNRVAVAGHSLGANIALYSSINSGDAAIKTIVLISPPIFENNMSMSKTFTKMNKYTDESTMERLNEVINGNQKPIMYIVGSLDGLATTNGAETFFNKTKSKKLLMIVNGANHVQFSSSGETGNTIAGMMDNKATISTEKLFELTATYVGAWLDYFVKDKSEAKQILEEGKNLYPETFSKYNLDI